jgi:SRSO17 transposase
VTPEPGQRRSAGDGAKGPRLYDWALGRLLPPQQSGFEQALLIRRPLDAPADPKQLAYYLTCAPSGTLLETRVAVAGRRGTIEESLEAATGEVGLDQYEVRPSHGWSRHRTLALLALASLAVVRSRLAGATTADPKGGPPWLSPLRRTAS